MNIPEGYVLVPVDQEAWQRKWAFDKEKPYKEKNENGRMAWAHKFIFHPITPNKIFSDDVPLYSKRAYDEAKELAACRAHWEKNPNCIFSDMWFGWKTCAKSRARSAE